MNLSRAYISSFAELENGFRSNHMKLSFLWHDEIMLDLSNDYRRQNFPSQIINGETLDKKQLSIFTDVFVPLQDRVSKELLEAHESSRPIGYPRWGKEQENYTYSNPKNAEQYAHNVLLAQIRKEWGNEDFNVEHAEGRARVAIDTVSQWEYIQQETRCILEANLDEQLAMTSANMFNAKSQEAIEPFSLFQANVPNLSSVSWAEIINIKKAGNFDKLRDKLGEIISVSPSSLSLAQDELGKIETKAMEEIIEKYRPNISKVAIESAVANIPGIPFFNPASAFFGLRDTYNEKKKFNELSWFYLLRDVRSLTTD